MASIILAWDLGKYKGVASRFKPGEPATRVAGEGKGRVAGQAS